MSDTPASPSHGSMGEVTHEGMTLRDYFAGQALSSLLLGRNVFNVVERSIAKDAYQLADAMMEARKDD